MYTVYIDHTGNTPIISYCCMRVSSDGRNIHNLSVCFDFLSFRFIFVYYVTDEPHSAKDNMQ